jgi:protein TonB
VALPPPTAPAAAAEAPSSAHPTSPAISGEVADRPVLSFELPVYPDWATAEAIEVSVTLRFAVLPDGRVKDGVRVERTAGFADFDRNAVAALRRWRFEPLPADRAEEHWGTITFHFRLRDS